MELDWLKKFLLKNIMIYLFSYSHNDENFMFTIVRLLIKEFNLNVW